MCTSTESVVKLKVVGTSVLAASTDTCEMTGACENEKTKR